MDFSLHQMLVSHFWSRMESLKSSMWQQRDTSVLQAIKHRQYVKSVDPYGELIFSSMLSKQTWKVMVINNLMWNVWGENPFSELSCCFYFNAPNMVWNGKLTKFTWHNSSWVHEKLSAFSPQEYSHPYIKSGYTLRIKIVLQKVLS